MGPRTHRRIVGLVLVGAVLCLLVVGALRRPDPGRSQAAPVGAGPPQSVSTVGRGSPLNAFQAGNAAVEAYNATTTTTTTAEPQPAPTTTTAPRRQHTPRPAVTSPSEQSGLPCGGDLPPCWVLDRESGYNDGNPWTYDIHAYNPTGCGGRGCRGKWQCDPRSCNGTGTEAQQDAEARELWDHGRGCSNWGAC